MSQAPGVLRPAHSNSPPRRIGRAVSPRPVLTRPRRGIAVLAALLIGLLLWLPVGPAAAAPHVADPPDITAQVGIVVEYPSGRVLFDKDMHKHMAEASTTKIMTALLTLQRTRLSDEVTILEEDQVGESTMGLVPGETQTIENLLYGLMLPSGNDAAMALARTVGSTLTEPADKGPVDRFIALMNRTAQQMGLADTHFVNPHGFDDPNHYTSAYDLASITWYAFHDPQFNKVVGTLYWDAPRHGLKNTNEMLTRYDGADGVKTGWTGDAGLCLVASATRSDRRIITVILNAVNWWDDGTALLDYGFAQPPATTDDPGTLLNIAYRAQLLWFLASGLPTPLPLAPTPAPIAIPTTLALAAGGGPAAQVVPNDATATAAPPAPTESPASDPAVTGATGASNPPPVGTVVQGQQEFSWLPWVLAVLLLVGLLVYTRRQRRTEPRPLAVTTGSTATSVPVSPAPPAAPPSSARRALPSVESRTQAAPAPATNDPAAVAPLDLDSTQATQPHSALRTPQSKGAPDPRPWRVSLLAHDDPALHAQRALAMAARGQEGTSLAEFLMTLDINPEFEFDGIPGFYDMSPAGYMALARAYAKRERPRYARALLRLALDQYPNDPHLAHFLASLNTESQP